MHRCLIRFSAGASSFADLFFNMERRLSRLVGRAIGKASRRPGRDEPAQITNNTLICKAQALSCWLNEILLHLLNLCADVPRPGKARRHVSDPCLQG